MAVTGTTTTAGLRPSERTGRMTTASRRAVTPIDEATPSPSEPITGATAQVLETEMPQDIWLALRRKAASSTYCIICPI